MELSRFLSVESIAVKESHPDREAVWSRLAELAVLANDEKANRNANPKDGLEAKAILDGIRKRESEGSTGIGGGLAIAHCKTNAVEEPILAALTLKNGVEYGAIDGKPVDLIFLIVVPEGASDEHLGLISQLAILLMNPQLEQALKLADSAEKFYEQLMHVCEGKSAPKQAEGIRQDMEQGRETGQATGKIDEPKANELPLVLAVTGCPTGVAHTYMAAEALKQEAQAAGLAIKVETRGAKGVENELTPEEIEKAICIIVASDTKVPMDRFAGKKLIRAHVGDAVGDPTSLLYRAKVGDVSVYESKKERGSAKAGSSAKADKGKTAEENGKTSGKQRNPEHKREGQGLGHAFYVHLMSGVNHMLPFVIGGGILMAIAFLIDTICGYGSTGGANFGNCTPLSSFFKYTGGMVMNLMVPVLAGYIAYSIADQPGLAVGFAGGLLSTAGNAASADYIWSGKTQGFMDFINRFGFTQPGGGSTVSGFLGGILAGFLAGGIVLLLKKAFAKLPKSLEGIKPTLLYPLLGVFLISVLMCFIFNPLIGLINNGITTMLGAVSDAGFVTVLALILGALMAIDMGGPINKAAYLFGSGMLGTANDLLSAGASMDDPAVQTCYITMGAIMLGGMVPPIGIAIATRLFPKKFTRQERSSWISNIVMGCSFITEGAIPFAAADPGHVIPCTMIGAGVAGFISASFKCTLMAPHGGIFVFATVGHPLMYVVALLAGAFTTAILLGILKKPATEE